MKDIAYAWLLTDLAEAVERELADGRRWRAKAGAVKLLLKWAAWSRHLSEDGWRDFSRVVIAALPWTRGICRLIPWNDFGKGPCAHYGSRPELIWPVLGWKSLREWLGWRRARPPRATFPGMGRKNG